MAETEQNDPGASSGDDLWMDHYGDIDNEVMSLGKEVKRSVDKRKRRKVDEWIGTENKVK